MKGPEDDWDDEEDDDDWEDDEDFEDSAPEDESETLPCPNCGSEVFEDADMCPTCHHAIVFSNNPWNNRHWLWVMMGALGTAAVIIALI